MPTDSDRAAVYAHCHAQLEKKDPSSNETEKKKTAEMVTKAVDAVYTDGMSLKEWTEACEKRLGLDPSKLV